MPVDLVVYTDVSVPFLDADVRAAVDRLRGCGASLDAFRSGSLLATASVRGEVVGCAWAWPAPDAVAAPVPPGLRALGPDRYAEWLAGGLELAAIAVDPRHRDRGIGSSLLGAALTPARRRAGWTQLTGVDVVEVGGWLRRRGWVVAAADRDGTGEVLLDPRHPAVAEVTALAPVLLGRPAADSRNRRR